MEIGAVVGRSLFNNAVVIRGACIRRRVSQGRVKTAETHESLGRIASAQEPGSTIFGWAKEYGSSAGARNRA